MNILISILLLTLTSYLTAIEERPIVIIVPSYNNEEWFSRNIESLLNQDYSNYRIIYIDDHSTDLTKSKVEVFVKRECRNKSYRSFHFNHDLQESKLKIAEIFKKKINSRHAFFTLITNQHRVGALANQYRAISSCKDEEIIVLVDGDDWLSNNEVLQTINNAYSSGEVWLTHGSLLEYPSEIKAWCEPIPLEVIINNTFRGFKCPSHLRTFQAWLFKKIQFDDLIYNGEFFPMTSDMAIMYPMIEMCGERHSFIEKTTYIYNMKNPINDNKVDAELQRSLDDYIRQKKPYERITHY